MMSVVIPAFNEEENIENTANVIGKILFDAKIPCELIFVDDGSSDKSWEIIQGLSGQRDQYVKVRGIKFSRNFGKEGAIFAGLEVCKGDCAVVIDCDLQHPPELMVEMHRLWEQGWQVVEAVKSDRGKESSIHRFFARTFYGMMKRSSNINMDGASDYKLMDRQVVDVLNRLPERQTFFRALSSWVGFKTTKVEFEVAPRNAGKSKWNFSKLFKFALSNLTGFTNVPMQIVTVTGVIFMILSVAMAINTLINFFTGNAAAGFSTVILLILLSSSLIMIALGIIGYYISKIYEEIKDRPRYIVAKDTDNDEKGEKERNDNE